jgi:hypothetical protein
MLFMFINMLEAILGVRHLMVVSEYKFFSEEVEAVSFFWLPKLPWIFLFYVYHRNAFY